MWGHVGHILGNCEAMVATLKVTVKHGDLGNLLVFPNIGRGRYENPLQATN